MLVQKLSLDQMQVNWAQELNPILANPLVNGQLLKGIELTGGTNVINHKLGRNLQGWFLSAPLGAATVYQAAQQPNPSLTLTVVSSAAITTDIWVF